MKVGFVDASETAEPRAAEALEATNAEVRRGALSPGVAGPERAVVVSNAGCPYRNAPNRTGVFEGVPMPAEVSTAGCTFCDASAYERTSEGDAIALIVQQVEAVLRDRPEVREIAVQDDAAVRFLGRLGDALAPLGLGERTVLFSARADFLLELRADVEAALAGGFPARLAFHLVGFENFAQPELERFHKGTNAAQMERTVELLDEWARRFPSRFRVTKTGGFILFTPWTTLEDLRVNASAFRRLGFARHAERALLSELRLDPKLPLYWLAKRDGLLVEGDARGEDGSHPWRFRDALVERVHRRLREATRSGAVEDAALFELFEEALDEAAGVARGKKNRPLRMVRAPGDRSRTQSASTAIALNRACNQNCGFCAFRAPADDAPRARAARAIAAVRTAAQEGRETVVLTGAEPLLEWYLEDLVRLARDLGVRDVVVETNATLLAARGKGDAARGAAALAAAGVTRAVVAFNAVDPAVSDAITRDPGGLATTIEGVRALLVASIPVELAVALVPQNRGSLAEVARQARALFPTRAAGIEAVVARYVAESPRHRALGVVEAAAELTAGAEAAARADVPIRSAPGGELPPCVFDDPAAARSVLRLSATIVERDASQYVRIPACSSCRAADVCPGPYRASAAAVAKVARPLEDATRLGVSRGSSERARVLSEFRSQFSIGTPEGGVLERRVVRVNFHCNQACDFCFVSRELPAAEHALIVEEIRAAAKAGAILDLSGGEPTLNPRLPEYVALARELGVRELELQTNAIRMADLAFARTLSDAGLRQAFVSLHGTSAAVSDRVTAAPGTFDKTLAGLRNLRRLGVRVRLNFVLCGYNIDELAGFPDFVVREIESVGTGPRPDINFSFVAASTDNVPRDTGLIPRFSDVAWALATAYERATELGLVMTGFDSKCGVPACYMPRAIREQHFASNIPDDELARATDFTKSEVCAGCDLHRRCYGIRSTYAQLYGVGELRPIVMGELPAPSLPVAPRPGLRGTAWAAVGLSTAHTLRPDSAARLVDDGAFQRHPSPWVPVVDLGNDREVVQLEAGLREVVKVECGNVELAEAAAERLRARGHVASLYVGPAGPGVSTPRAIAFAGRTSGAVDEAIALEREITGPFRERGARVRRMGALLGYPACCVESFARSTDQDDATHIARLAAAHRGQLAFEQNWAAAPLRLFSHFPCSPTCAATARASRATLSRMSPSYRALVERALRSVVVLSTVERFAALVDSRVVAPGEVAYGGVLSHRNLGIDDGVLARPLMRAFYLEVIAPLEEGDHVVRTPTSLVVSRGGRRVAEVLFAGASPVMLDFTGERVVHRLPVAST